MLSDIKDKIRYISQNVEDKLAVQVAYTIEGEARKREVGNLQKLVATGGQVDRLVIVTREEHGTIALASGCSIEVVPAYEFLLSMEQ